MTPADLMALAAEHADVTKDDRGRADYSFDNHGLERFATALRALHMEEAAKVCDGIAWAHEATPSLGPELNSAKCAAAIRALK